MTTRYTPDELMITYMARQIEPGDYVVQGMATPMVFSAFLLAKVTHAPDVQFMYTAGNSVSQRMAQLSLTNIERVTVAGALRRVRMTEMHCDLTPVFQAKEFIRPAQVDGKGNTNNVVIGPFEQPKVRLPGCGGISDVTNFNPRLYVYVPRHSRRSLVEKLDFCSGVGYGDGPGHRVKMGLPAEGVQKIITNLCIFKFENEAVILESLHPGVTLEQVRAATGFDFEAPSLPKVTQPPTSEELQLLREQIDPLGVRLLETLEGSARLQKIKEILAREQG